MDRKNRVQHVPEAIHAKRLTTDAEPSAPGRLTDAQRVLLEDKFVLWERASRAYGSGQDADMSRDYNRRAAEALRAALVICSEHD